jgi:starvation-inducible DNA-binding protein
MEQLILQLKITQATAFSLYLKAHFFHWNVTGPFFSQFHDFFGDFYNDVWASVDSYAEHARTLDTFVPGSLVRFSELSEIEDETNVPPALTMVSKLYSDNEIMLQSLYKTHALAESAGKRGLVNFIEDRIDFHDKMHWMLKSYIS